MNLAIIATGTELTMGQILNRNAQWISEKVYKNLGLPTSFHLSVPDHRQWITDSLNFLSHHCEILITTGGLGPTRDDFTREVVSAWAEKELEFSASAWTHLNQYLEKRNRIPTSMHKQECYFPTDSTLYPNATGTALAFSFSPNEKIKTKIKRIFVLPGPPSEIDSVWPFVEADLKKLTHDLNKQETISWLTQGFPEIKIAELLEKELQGNSALQPCPFEIGYRLIKNMDVEINVEVKMTFLESEKPLAQIWTQKIDQALANCLVTKDSHG